MKKKIKNRKGLIVLVIIFIIVLFFLLVWPKIKDLINSQWDDMVDDKPILYLYPKKETKVEVSFSHPEYLETTYPKFNGKWEVTAKKDGSLYDKDGKYYYALYWDEKRTYDYDFKEGFYVEKEDAISFLEEKLEKIGFNEKEKNEFIMYWLPVLEKNEKSLVYFELTEERERHNKIEISPKLGSLLRI